MISAETIRHSLNVVKLQPPRLAPASQVGGDHDHQFFLLAWSKVQVSLPAVSIFDESSDETQKALLCRVAANSLSAAQQPRDRKAAI